MSERERLSEVYDHYRRDEGTQSRWSSTNPGNRAIVDERSRATERLLRQHWHTPSGRSCTLLDVGCGRYSLLAPTLDRSQQGVLDRLGVDLLLERVVDAERTSRFDALACADGTQLPIRDESVDLVALVTVLSSVLDDAIADAIAADVSRVLRPGGAVVWYDFRYRNPANSNTRPMVRSHVERLFPGLEAHWQSVTLLPPVARRLGKLCPLGYPALRTLPLLRSHLVGLLVKPGVS